MAVSTRLRAQWLRSVGSRFPISNEPPGSSKRRTISSGNKGCGVTLLVGMVRPQRCRTERLQTVAGLVSVAPPRSRFCDLLALTHSWQYVIGASCFCGELGRVPDILKIEFGNIKCCI